MFGLGTFGTLILCFIVWNWSDEDNATAQEVAELNYKMDKLMGKDDDVNIDCEF